MAQGGLQLLLKKYKNKSWPERILKFLASLELAVIIILALASISAVGTVYEARYNAEYAQKMIYHSPVMYFFLGLLGINLINVMIDRWPWKPHHAGFVLAHIGIITLLLGSLITRYWGVDGSLSLEIGGRGRNVVLSGTEINLYEVDKENYKKINTRQVDFLIHPPEKNKYEYILNGKSLKIVKFAPFAYPKVQVVPTEKEADGPGIRVQLQSSRVNMTQWIVRNPSEEKRVVPLGPANIVFHSGKHEWSGINEIALESNIKTKEIKYKIYSQRKLGLIKEGVARPGDLIATGWMDIEIRFLNFYPHAREDVSYEIKKRPTPMTTSAMQFEYNGAKYWVGLNSSTTFFTENKSYLISYNNTRLPLDFDLKLMNFSVGRYQGTMRASSYASDVIVDNKKKVKIYMNNPLKYKGYTFYQASFTEDEMGKPTSSILSVNRDPGRWVKNLGSFLIVLGTIILFYFKKVKRKKKP